MKKTLSALYLGITLGLGSGGIVGPVVYQHVVEAKQYDRFQEMRNTVGYIKEIGASFGFCSAVKINPNLVMTASHCVNLDQKVIFVDPVTGLEVEAIAIKVDNDQSPDLALLKLATHVPGPYAVLADGAVLGERAYAVGYPLPDMTEGNQVLTEGHVQGPLKEDPENYILTTVPVIFGNSGGALFNAKGELIGITSALMGLPGIGVLEHMTLFVPLAQIKEFINGPRG